ncbi:MAG TPA: THUMP domain-containing protein [Chitinophagaceae bacterium]|nr:THUMP domain-containing protein [Chitinophagaceae bacterium]
MSVVFEMVAKTLFGLEEVLETELKQLGAQHIHRGQRMVRFRGDQRLMWMANLCCRTAIKILIPIHHFKVQSEEELYRQVYQIEWKKYFDTDQTFAIDATVFSKRFTHSKYIALKTKDAIADHFRDRYGKRPSVDTQKPHLRLNVHIHEDQCNLSLDSSGASLHIRGYKTAVHQAPLNEVLAAGIIYLSGWDQKTHFYDPMCGGGTLLTEAAMMAANIPANIHRNDFAFEQWQDFDSALFQKLKDELVQQSIIPACSIQGADLDFKNVKIARENIHQAQLDEIITVHQADFFNRKRPVTEPMHKVINPPYNERIEIDTDSFYRKIGDTLKREYSGCKAWILTANAEAIKSVGLKPVSRIKLFNGSLEARLLGYELYEGSRKRNEA